MVSFITASFLLCRTRDTFASVIINCTLRSELLKLRRGQVRSASFLPFRNKVIFLCHDIVDPAVCGAQAAAWNRRLKPTVIVLGPPLVIIVSLPAICDG